MQEDKSEKKKRLFISKESKGPVIKKTVSARTVVKGKLVEREDKFISGGIDSNTRRNRMPDEVNKRIDISDSVLKEITLQSQAINISSIEGEALKRASRIMKVLSQVYLTGNEEDTAWVKLTIENSTHNLFRLLKMLNTSMNLLDLCINSINEDPSDSKLYDSYTRCQTAAINTQKELNLVFNDIDKMLKAFNTETIEKTPAKSDEEMNSNLPALRGNKALVEMFQKRGNKQEPPIYTPRVAGSSI